MFPVLFGGEDINANFRQIIGHIIKHVRLNIPEPQLSAKSAYNTFNADSGELVEYLLGVSALNYIYHRACVRKSSLAARREKIHVKIGELSIQKDLT